uniref:FlgO domain-containing protein n=1 Tax=Rheinheimera sp. BAL341 TaxID=1708203 RepID=A0A486XWE7_9GAMM
MRTLLALLGVSLVGCSNTLLNSGENESKIQRVEQGQMAAYPLHQYAGDIVMQMLQYAPGIRRGAKVAVGTYVSASNLSEAFEQDMVPAIGLQLQESLMTLLTQSGFSVVELRLADGISLAAEGEFLLTRQAMPAKGSVRADYLLSGTVIAQQHAFIVNSRLVDAQQNQIVAAATTEIPRNVMWSRDSVQLRNGKLYRTGP